MASSDPFGIDPLAKSSALTRVLGIDPGASGALGMLELPGWRVLCVRKLPTREAFDRRVLDERALAQLLRELSPSLVVIEKVQPLPQAADKNDLAAGGVVTRGSPSSDPTRTHRMGTVGAFNYGWTCGQIYSTVRIAGHDPVMVHPATWKSAAGLFGRGKEYADRKRMSLALARNLWPDVGISGDGCAEALLIARFGFASQMRFF